MQPENTILVTDFTLPTYVFANGQSTGVGFSNPENILLVDGDVASSNPNEGSASDITVAGYNFMYGGESIPQGAVIVGLEMQIIGYEGSATVPPITLDVALYDNVNGADNFYPYTDPITDLGQVMTTITIGTPTYLFNTNLSVDQINNIKMNLTANGDISLDSFLVRVYFYIPATVTPPTPDAGTCIDCDSPIQVQAMALALPFLVGQTVFYLQKGSFAYPNGVPVQPGDVGACGGHIPFVFDQGKNKQTNGNFEENAMLDTTTGSWSVLPSGIIAVDLGSVNQRGLDFKTPGTHVTALMSDHDANSEVIISNNTPYNLTLVRRCQVGTVFSAPIEVDKDGSEIVLPAVKLNFIGGGVTVVQNGDDAEQADITIAGAGGTQPPQVVGTGSGTSGNTQVTSLTYTLPVSGTNRGALVQVTIPSGVSVSSVTVGGVAATHIVTESASGIQVQQFFLVAPAVGTQNVVVTLGTAAYIVSGAECLIGVNQSSSTGATHSATGTGTAISNTLTTTVDNSLVIDAIGTTAAPLIFTIGAGQSNNWIHDAATDTVEGASSIQSAGTEPDNVVMSWTISKSTLWVSAAVEIKGITSGSSGGQVDIQFQDEGSNLGSTGTVDHVNYTGSGVTASRSGNTVTVNIPGGGSSIDLQTNGVDNTDQSKLNLIAGSNVTLTPDGSGGVTISSTGGGSINPSIESVLFDDFIGGGLTVVSGTTYSTIGELGWYATNASQYGNSDANHPGVISIIQNATQRAGMQLCGPNTYTFAPDIQIANLTVQTLVKLITVTTNSQFFVGITDGNAGNTNFTNFGVEKVGFIYDHAAAVWKGYASNGTTQTSTSGIADTGDWVQLKIVTSSDGSSASFYFNGSLLGTISVASLSPGTGTFTMSYQAGGDSNQEFIVDYFQMQQTLSR